MSLNPDTLHSHLQQRYRDPEIATVSQANETLAVLLAHRSVRRYLPTPVSDETLHTLVAAAQSASTSSNIQAWSVIAVRDPERKARLAACAGKQQSILQAPLFLVWVADFARLRQVADDHQAPLVGQEYLEAGIIGMVDAALAAQNAVVAGESLGLGSVYIGAIRNQPDDVCEILGLPPGVFPVFGLCVGYPDPTEDAQIKPRLPQSAVLHHETYSLPAQRMAVAQYEERAAAFYAEQQLSHSWISRMLARMGTVEALHGRDQLRESLDKQGFPLR
jgi:nitroreductase